MPAVLSGLTTSLFLLASPAGNMDVAEVQAVLASPAGQNATGLVRATRAHEYFFNMLRQIEQKLRNQGRLEDTQLTCLDALTPADYETVLAVTLLSHHDPAVVENALAFYSSPVGSQFLRMVYEKNWRNGPEDFPLPPDRPKESMTIAQMRDVANFRDSPLTGPFADPRMITQWDEARKAAAMLWRIRQIQCGIPEDVLPEDNPFTATP